MTYLISHRATKSYLGEASVALVNPDQGLIAAGIGAASTPPLPQQNPEVNARTVTTPFVLRPAAKILKAYDPSITPAKLSDSTSASVEATSSLVVIDATSNNPLLATRIADAVAKADVDYVTGLLRQSYATAESGLRARTRQLLHSTSETFIKAQYAAQILKLDALSASAIGAQVVRYSTIRPSAVSPRTTRNTILAGIVGLTVAIIIAFLRAALNRSVRRAAEVEDALGVPTLGRVTDAALGRLARGHDPDAALGRLARLGKGRRVMRAEDVEAFRIIRANLDALSRESPIGSLAVTSLLPEEGKSTVASALAVASAWAGRRTLLIESDLRRSSLARRTGLEAAPGLGELLKTPGAQLETFLQRMPGLESVGPGDRTNGGTAQDESRAAILDVITAGAESAMPAEMLASQAFRDLLSRVRDAYDLVILDTAPLLAVADALEVVRLVDAILVCVRIGQSTGDSLRTLRTTLDSVPPRPTGAVVTGVRPGDDEYDYSYYGSTHPARRLTRRT